MDGRRRIYYAIHAIILLKMINSNKNYSIEKLRWRWHITIILRRTHMQMTLTTQIYGFCRPHEVDRLADRVSVCIDETSAWMKSNRLQLSPTKTEVLWCSSSRRQHQIPTGPIQVGNTSVLPVSQVRDLGVYLCLLYTSPSPRDRQKSRMPSSA